MTTDLKSRRTKPGFHFLDNGASAALKTAITTLDIKYQLVTPINRRAKNAERAVQKFQNHFIAELCNSYQDFHLQLWYRLLHQATISLNLINQSRIHPHLSAYMHIFGKFYYNLTPIAGCFKPRRPKIFF